MTFSFFRGLRPDPFLSLDIHAIFSLADYFRTASTRHGLFSWLASQTNLCYALLISYLGCCSILERHARASSLTFSHRAAPSPDTLISAEAPTPCMLWWTRASRLIFARPEQAGWFCWPAGCCRKEHGPWGQCEGAAGHWIADGGCLSPAPPSPVPCPVAVPWRMRTPLPGERRPQGARRACQPSLNSSSLRPNCCALQVASGSRSSGGGSGPNDLILTAVIHGWLLKAVCTFR